MSESATVDRQPVAHESAARGVRANTVLPGWIRTEMADAEMDQAGMAMLAS
jgi:NAD(P)-dependent dehydrogenase (short-subunit alcohol dehydrogenase family)